MTERRQAKRWQPTAKDLGVDPCADEVAENQRLLLLVKRYREALENLRDEWVATYGVGEMSDFIVKRVNDALTTEEEEGD